MNIVVGAAADIVAGWEQVVADDIQQERELMAQDLWETSASSIHMRNLL